VTHRYHKEDVPGFQLPYVPSADSNSLPRIHCPVEPHVEVVRDNLARNP
jgi:hypothetical protein